MTHSSRNRHLVPRNRQYNSGPQIGLNNLFLIQLHFYNFWKNVFETKTSIHRFSFHRALQLLKTYSIISSWKIKYFRICFPDNINCVHLIRWTWSQTFLWWVPYLNMTQSHIFMTVPLVYSKNHIKRVVNSWNQCHLYAGKEEKKD